MRTMEEERMVFFYEIFDASLPRHGPGDDTSTERALEALLPPMEVRHGKGIGGMPRVLDLGCGAGPQTIALARVLDGRILAVDNHEPYLAELRRRAQAAGVLDKIETCLADMRLIDLPPGSFDLVWSEGALFVFGFTKGLEVCRDLLAPGGLMAVTELCWLLPDPPEECRTFLEREYPAIMDISANLAAIEERGLKIVGHFTLPESSWLDNYYAPLEARLRSLRTKYATERWKLEMIEGVQSEIDLYRRYSSWYGYEFFMMRRQ